MLQDTIQRTAPLVTTPRTAKVAVAVVAQRHSLLRREPVEVVVEPGAAEDTAGPEGGVGAARLRWRP